MSVLQNNIGFYTDYYELIMAQGYFLSRKHTNPANFDYFFRKNPYGGGFVIFAGLADLLEMLENYRFDKEDCQYLQSMGFDNEFLEYLKTFKFKGNIYSVDEGEVVFPDEPIVRIEGSIMETQLVESLVLNILNFQSLIATKAARIRLVAGDKLLLDFGLRRAQGLGAIHASRAAVIGGFNKTSNTYSARQFGIIPSGTMAHSWVQTFDNELEAFREFVKFYPETAVLLVDTYNTLNMGVPNAIKVAKEMEKQGERLSGIRLDSGDLAYLSKKARGIFDESGLNYVKIVASNQLDEYVIKSLLEQNAPIDAFGVGTSLVTGKDGGALDGVYKLSEVSHQPTMKLSDNISKITLPGKKKIYRFMDVDQNCFFADGIELHNSHIPQIIYHPQQPDKNTPVNHLKYEENVKRVMENGETILNKLSVDKISGYVQHRLKQLPEECKRFENPHIYKVGIGRDLLNLRNKVKVKI
jgi:nicotinate phosphoribosyltransferase